MRGVGGPLLCIDDLLSDLREDGGVSDNRSSNAADLPESTPTFKPSHLPKLFQENYEKLNNALADTNHSWTDLTLELCNALETTNKLVHSTNNNIGILLDDVKRLEKMINQRDSDIADVKAIQSSLQAKGAPNCENHFRS